MIKSWGTADVPLFRFFIFICSSSTLFATHGPFDIFFDILYVKNLILFLPSDPETLPLGPFFGYPIQLQVILLSIFKRICNNQLLLIEFTLRIQGVPVLSEGSDVVFLQAVFKLEQFL